MKCPYHIHILTCIVSACAACVLFCVPVVHVDIALHGCTDSGGETMYWLDGEEIGHADFTKGKFVMTLPEFADQFTYVEGTYEGAFANQQICKQNLQTIIQAYKSPAVAEGESK